MSNPLLPVFRLRNAVEHFYTISPSERDSAISQYGYTFEGVAFYAWVSPDNPLARDDIAIQVMPALIQSDRNLHPDEVANEAYRFADAMIANQ